MGWFTERKRVPRRVVADETLGQFSFYAVLPEDAAQAQDVPNTANALAMLYALMTRNAAHLVPEVLKQAYELQCEHPEAVILVHLAM